jgi:hypothetical protein
LMTPSPLPSRAFVALALAVLGGCAATPPATPPAPAAPAAPVGEVQGSAFEHTAASRAGAIAGAQVALPAAAGQPAFFGKWREVPAAATAGRFPQGIASVAPDSFALPDRLTYKSPVGRDVYERIHALRASEIALGLDALKLAPWADATRVVLAGTSEGAVAVARHGATGIVGRAMFAWSCEDNYMVAAHRTAVPVAEPVLNVISASDPFFSRSNGYLGNPAALGHCGGALAQHKAATVVLIPGAPHTLLNLPAARHATLGFLRDVLKP